MEVKQVVDLKHIEFKAGVPRGTLQPQMQHAVIAVAEVYESYNKKLVVTSTTDGKHMEGSRHYVGLAFDCRTNFFTPSRKKIVAEAIKVKLGIMYDVVVEATHIHIEWKYLYC